MSSPVITPSALVPSNKKIPLTNHSTQTRSGTSSSHEQSSGESNSAVASHTKTVSVKRAQQKNKRWPVQKISHSSITESTFHTSSTDSSPRDTSESTSSNQQTTLSGQTSESSSTLVESKDNVATKKATNDNFNKHQPTDLSKVQVSKPPSHNARADGSVDSSLQSAEEIGQSIVNFIAKTSGDATLRSQETPPALTVSLNSSSSVPKTDYLSSSTVGDYTDFKTPAAAVEQQPEKKVEPTIHSTQENQLQNQMHALFGKFLKKELIEDKNPQDKELKPDSKTNAFDRFMEKLLDRKKITEKKGKIRMILKSRRLQEVPFTKGQIIDDRFQIVEKMKAGGFGHIFQAMDLENNDNIVALKIESSKNISSSMEAHVLKLFQFNIHCPKLFAIGTTNNFGYVALQLLGPNLSELRRRCSCDPARLSISCALRVGIQAVKSIEALHILGYLHRDIKPSNFAISSTPNEDNTIYLIDYGLCRIYLNKNGEIRRPRDRIGFRGTIRYASLTSHFHEELSRKDDLISMFYMLFELSSGLLPWKFFLDFSRVKEIKAKYSVSALGRTLPEFMADFSHHLETLGYSDRPNYSHLVNCIVGSLIKMDAIFDENFDWQFDDCKRLYHWELPRINEMLVRK